MKRTMYILTFYLTDTRHIYKDRKYQIKFYHSTMSFFILTLRNFLAWFKEHPNYVIVRIELEEKEEVFK